MFAQRPFARTSDLRRNHALFDCSTGTKPDHLEAALIGAATQLQDARGIVAGAVDQDAPFEDVFVDAAAARSARTSISSSQAIKPIDETTMLECRTVIIARRKNQGPADGAPAITLTVMRRTTPAVRSRRRRLNRPIATMADHHAGRQHHDLSPARDRGIGMSPAPADRPATLLPKITVDSLPKAAARPRCQ